MSAPHVLVVGGGLAGIRAALSCADAGARVTLLEERGWLGGATWSMQRRGLCIDNGQHVFLRCCRSYRGLLARLHVADRVTLQRRLAVPVLAPGRPAAWIRRHALPSPAHLAPSLLRFTHLPLRARLRVARTARRLAALDRADPALDRACFGDWLACQGEGAAAIDGFWDLLVRPTLNLSAREASLALAAKVFQTGLFGEASAADIGWSEVPLAQLHGEPAAAALAEASVKLHLKAKVEALRAGTLDASEGAVAVRVAGSWLSADALVLAVPHPQAAELLPAEAGLAPAALRALGSAPIVNLHVVWSRPVMTEPFVATLDSPLQWIFDRTQSAGLKRGQLLAVSLSAAGEYDGLSREALTGRFVPAFEALFPAARRARVEDLFVTREPAATFFQGPGSRGRRPGPRSEAPGLYLAGAWTDTGWPATMEGAVQSGEAAAACLLQDLRGNAAHASPKTWVVESDPRSREESR